MYETISDSVNRVRVDIEHSAYIYMFTCPILSRTNMYIIEQYAHVSLDRWLESNAMASQ